MLGPLELAADGDRLSLGGPKQRAVLTVLAARAGEVVPTDTLADVVWGGDEPANPQQSLQVYVSNLRGVLDEAGIEAAIERHGEGYVLRIEPDLVDVHRFEHRVDEGTGLVSGDPERAASLLRDTLRLWRGRPFGDLADHGALRGEVTRLEEARLRAIEARIEADLARGGGGELVGELRRLADEHPLRERLWAHLMVALYRSGRQGEALEAYEQARRTLAEELGADPSPRLREVHAAVLRQDPSLEVQRRSGDGGSTRPSAGIGPPTAAGRVSSEELIGRSEELAGLRGLARAAAGGQPHVVLLGGDAGVGKTRLLQAVVAEVGDEIDVLVGRCLELGEGAIPFAPIAQVVRRLVRDLPPQRSSEVLGSAKQSLARIVPELGELDPDRTVDLEQERSLLFAGVHRAVVRFSRDRPVLLVFEDVHWADRSTLDLLGYLARNLHDERLLLAATFRTDELHRRHPLRDVLGELSRIPGVVRIDLAPLSEEEVGAQLRSILGADPEPDLLRQVVQRSGGNPFFVEELTAALQEGGGAQLRAGLRDVVGSRLGRLPDEVRDVLDVAAVAGRRVDHRLLAAATGEDPVRLARLLRPAVDRHVLVAEETGYRFRHDLVREVVEDELLPGERTALHRRVAEVLSETPELAAEGAGQVDAELAHHWYAALELQPAFDASLRAAERARESAAFSEALTHFERALDLWAKVDTEHERTGVLQRAAETASQAGRYSRAINLLRLALDELEDDPAREADLRCQLAGALWWEAADFEEAREEARRAHALLADAPPSSSKADTVHTLARLHMLGGAHNEAIPLAREAVALAQETGAEQIEADSRITLGTSLCQLDVETGIRELEAGTSIAHQIDDVPTRQRGLNNLLAMHRDQSGAGRDVIERLVAELLESMDSDWPLHGPADKVLLSNVAFDAVMAGKWDRADAMLARIGRYHLEGADLGFFLCSRMSLRWMRGQLDAAKEDAARVHDIGIGGPWYPSWARMTEAAIAADEGRLDDVQRLVDRGREEVGGFGHQWDPTLMALQMLHSVVRVEVDAAVAKEEGQRDDHAERAVTTLREMQELYEDETPATPGERQWAEGYLALAEAEVSRTREEAQPELWREARGRAVEAYWRLYARWRHAEALTAAGERDEAETELRGAHHEAVDLGAEQLRGWIHASAAENDISVEEDGVS
ncbi:MAG: BTAD domain-containing putative transcriptional regulator [Nitriliruptorales bacterium]|nr:BTAD domain-containing putative transcriptional regulator [Nitriliruptorales bacterium]